MKKILLILLVFLVLAFPVNASATITYYFKDSQGNYLDDVDVIIYDCENSDCSQVSIPNMIIPNQGNSSNFGLDYDITMTYPTNLETPYGYGVYYTKSCYLPVESVATWHGSGSTDKIIYFNQKEDAISEINYLKINDDLVNDGITYNINQNENINIGASIQSAFSDYPGAPVYVPGHLKEEFYSSLVEASLTITKENQIVYSDFKDYNIYMDDSQLVDFDDFSLSESGLYKMEFKTFVNDCQVKNSIEQVFVAYLNVNQISGNHAPVLDPIDNIRVAEGAMVKITATASDIDGDVLSFSIDDSRFTQTSDGVFEWQTKTGDLGEYLVTVKVEDGSGAKDGQRVKIEVLRKLVPGNSEPELNFIGNKEVYENEVLEFIISGDDIDGDVLNYDIENLPTGASFDENTKTFSWKPDYDVVKHVRPSFWNKILGLIDPDQNGKAKYFYVNFIVSDGQLKDNEQIRIVVYDVNRDPVISKIRDIVASEGDLIDIDPIASDLDKEDEAWLSFDFSNPFNDNGIWQTQKGDAGVYNIDVKVEDGYGGYDLTTFKVRINPVYVPGNHAPVLDPIGDYQICLGSTIDFDVSATDIDGDVLTYDVHAPAGVIYNFVGQHFSWTPNNLGVFDFIFSVDDGKLSDMESVSIEVIDCGTEEDRDIDVHRFSVMAYPLSLKVNRGNNLIIYSRVKNTGTEDEDLLFRLVIQDLGIIKEKNIEVNNGYDSHTEFFEIEIPSDAKKGVYLAKVSAYNQDHKDYKLLSFEVV